MLTAPASPPASEWSPRWALGRLVLVASGLGYPLTQAVIARFGRRGAQVVEGVSIGLLVRDAALVGLGTTRRLRRLPAALLWLELAAAAAASVLGLAAVVRPGLVVEGAGARPIEAARRLAVGLLFGLHTYRFWIYLSPDRGLADGPAVRRVG